MAKRRYVSDSFWSDMWIENLDPLEKYLYLYLITNQLVSVCGIYEIQTKRMAYETGIDKEMILKMLGRFQEEGKVYYYDGLIFIVNFVKNQSVTSKDDNLRKGIEREIKELGTEKLSKITQIEGAYKVVQGAYKDVPIPYFTLLYSTLPIGDAPKGVLEEVKVEKEVKLKSDYILKTWKQASDLLNDGGYVGLSIPLRRSEDLEKARKVLEKKGVTDEEWVQGLRNYVKDIEKRNKEQSYATHRFKLLEFLTRKGGLVTFI